MTAFLIFQIDQQAVIMISLKIGLPKDVWASISISRGWREVSQEMFRVFQQYTLKGHSKKRRKQLSSLPVLQSTQE
jgi:hypothetical protein